MVGLVCYDVFNRTRISNGYSLFVRHEDLERYCINKVQKSFINRALWLFL